MADLYQRLENPRICSSRGSTSRIVFLWRHRQIGAPSLVSSVKPSLRSRSEKSMYAAYEVISAMASTSYVGRTSAAALSVMSRAVVLPPTKANSRRSGFSRRAASMSSARLCFDICWAQSLEEFSLCDLALTHTPISDCVDQGKEFVKDVIAESC